MHTLNDTQSAKNFIMWFCYLLLLLLLQFLSFLTSFKQLAIAIPMGISSNNNNKTLPRVYNFLCIALTFFLSFSDVSRTHVLLLKERFKELAKKKKKQKRIFRRICAHKMHFFLELYVQLILRVTGSKLLLRLSYKLLGLLTST